MEPSLPSDLGDLAAAIDSDNDNDHANDNQLPSDLADLVAALDNDPALEKKPAAHINDNPQRQKYTCPVCMGATSHVLEPPCCGSIFCRKCVQTWFARNSSCPSCRVKHKKAQGSKIPQGWVHSKLMQREINEIAPPCKHCRNNVFPSEAMGHECPRQSLVVQQPDGSLVNYKITASTVMRKVMLMQAQNEQCPVSDICLVSYSGWLGDGMLTVGQLGLREGEKIIVYKKPADEKLVLKVTGPDYSKPVAVPYSMKLSSELVPLMQAHAEREKCALAELCFVSDNKFLGDGSWTAGQLGMKTGDVIYVYRVARKGSVALHI